MARWHFARGTKPVNDILIPYKCIPLSASSIPFLPFTRDTGIKKEFDMYRRTIIMPLDLSRSS